MGTLIRRLRALPVVVRLITALFVAALLVASLSPLGAQEPFIRGDVDGNGVVDFIVDAASLSNALFSGGTAPGCFDAADFNDDGSVDLTDIQALLNAGFVTMVSVPPPYPDCGLDPTADSLTCANAGSCAPPAAPPASDDFTLAFGSAVEVGADESEVTVTFGSTGDDLVGWSFGVCHDPASAAILSVGVGPDLDDLDPDFENRTLYPGAGWTCAVLLSFSGGTVLGPGTYQLYEANYETFGDADSDLGICDTIGNPPVPISFAGAVPSGGGPGMGYVDTIIPTTLTGSVVPVDVQGDYIRGDANGEGIVNLADSIFLINWTFQSGPAPSCLRAADSNGDGTLNIADSIWLINYFFLSGPTPPPPFPTCAFGSGSPLSCQSYTPCD